MAALFHPRVEAWFSQRFGTPTEPQERGWPAIATGADTLIAAPTGSGKTLAAFLTAIDALVRHPDAATRIIYVSPLKALANDVQKISSSRSPSSVWPVKFVSACAVATRCPPSAPPCSAGRRKFWSPRLSHSTSC